MHAAGLASSEDGRPAVASLGVVTAFAFWTTGGSGSGQLPALSLGDYRIRIANIKGGRVKSQQAHLLRVFGTVPFTALFKNGTSGPATCCWAGGLQCQ